MPDEIALRLDSTSRRGWFGGRTLVARNALSVEYGVPLAVAAATLQSCFDSQDGPLTAVIAGYGGDCTVVRFAEVTERAVADSDAGGPAGSVSTPAPLLTHASWDLKGSEFRRGVIEVRERIAAGDVYVLNLTARLRGELTMTPEDAYGVLLEHWAGDMCAYFGELPGNTPWLASASPERFLRVRSEHGERRVDVSPIKGTRPRGAQQGEDEALRQDLLADEKERAEHLMVVDLERNDLGIVCVPGSVRVDPLYEVVTTPYCHQLVSTVTGIMRAEASLADLLHATFPCGSVTGAPKRSAIRIAEELEATARGPYCGALLVTIPGELDSSVLIRTLAGDARDASVATWGAGCGVTFESAPPAEYLEMLLKASPATGEGCPQVALRETMRVSFGTVPLLDRHLARLAEGGAGPSVIARVRHEVARQLADPVAGLEYARLALTVIPDGDVVSGLSADESSLAVEGGPRLVPVEVEAAPTLPHGAAKPASRHYWDKPHRVARMVGGDQAILHLPDGTLIDGSTATVWLVSEGRLMTPAAPPAIAGVARGLVFDVAAELGIAAEECALTLHDLESAGEVFLSNGVGLVVSARGRGGVVTERIAARVRAYFGGALWR